MIVYLSVLLPNSYKSVVPNMESTWLLAGIEVIMIDTPILLWTMAQLGMGVI